MKVQAIETRPILIDEVKKSLPTPSTLQKFEVQENRSGRPHEGNKLIKEAIGAQHVAQKTSI